MHKKLENKLNNKLKELVKKQFKCKKSKNIKGCIFCDKEYCKIVNKISEIKTELS